MPTYEYECKSCGHTFEAFQSMSDAPLSSCPACGQGIRRLINGGSGVIFKGSGFYVTDKKGSGGPGSSSSKPADAKTGDVKTGGDTPAASSAADPGSGGKTGQSTGASNESGSASEKKAAS